MFGLCCHYHDHHRHTSTFFWFIFRTVENLTVFVLHCHIHIQNNTLLMFTINSNLMMCVCLCGGFSSFNQLSVLHTLHSLRWFVHPLQTLSPPGSLTSASPCLQVSREKNRFEKLMEHFSNDDSNLDFMVGLAPPQCLADIQTRNRMTHKAHLRTIFHCNTPSASRWPACSS